MPDEVGRSSETGSDLPPSTGPSPSVCIALPEKLLLFWGEMANPSSPLKESHPLEYQMYQDLSTKPPSDLVRLGSAFDVGIADCLAAAGNRRPDVGATLLGRSLARFRTNNVIKNILLGLLGLDCRTASSGELRSVGAIVASTVDHLWIDRPTNHASAVVETLPSSSFPAPSTAETGKISYHAGWTLKRVRDKVCVRRRAYSARSQDGKEVELDHQVLTILINNLGEEDTLDAQTGRYLFFSL